MTAELDQRVAPLGNPTGQKFTPVDPARPSGAKMKGFPLLHLLDLMDQRGPQVAAAWRATLPEALRASTERSALTSVSWVPVEFYFHGVTFLSQQQGAGARGALCVGHHTASQDIGAFFRFVLAMTSPATVLGLSGRFWKSYFDRSSLHVLSSTPTSVVVEARDWPLSDEHSLYEMAGSLVAWMEASRARNVCMPRLELTKPGILLIEANWS